MEDADNVLLVLHHHGLRDLQLQLVSVERRPTQGTLDFPYEVGVLKLPHREVHAHRYPGTLAVLVAPLSRLAAGLLQHPLPDGDDKAGFFGNLDELRGHHEAAPRMSPSHQGLHLGNGVGIERHLGLIVDLEAALFDRPPEIFLELEALEGPGVHAGTEHLVAPFGPLGLIQGCVRVPQEVGRPYGATVTKGDPHAGGDGDFVLGDGERLVQGRQQTLRDTDRSTRIPEVCEQDGELVPTETGGAVPRAETVAYAQAHLDQEPVTQVVPEAIVYDLEVVQVYEEYGDDPAGALGVGQLLLQAIEEEGTVRQIGQGIVQSLVAALLVGALEAVGEQVRDDGHDHEGQQTEGRDV